jgi:single-strand DNA-binding protein
MNNLNSVLIEGNLVRDPVFKNTEKGTPICNFTIASNRFFRQDTELEKEVGFFDVEAFSKLAEACRGHGRKGRAVRVVGRLKQNRWINAEGKSFSRIVIVAEHIEYRPDISQQANSSAPENAEEGAA